jgi:hypothetical protein
MYFSRPLTSNEKTRFGEGRARGGREYSERVVGEGENDSLRNFAIYSFSRSRFFCSSLEEKPKTTCFLLPKWNCGGKNGTSQFFSGQSERRVREGLDPKGRGLPLITCAPTFLKPLLTQNSFPLNTPPNHTLSWA